MNRFVRHLMVAALLLSQLLGAKTAPLFESRYYTFYSSPRLNAHLFLYSRALAVKQAQLPHDSLLSRAAGDKLKALSSAHRTTLVAALRFYRDSLLSKDLLFDSLMRQFEDGLAAGGCRYHPREAWQVEATRHLDAFQPLFEKLWWPAIDSLNRTWLVQVKPQISALEARMVPELQRVFRTPLPDAKIRVDLVCDATWAGAYSYREMFSHVMLSSVHASNQGALAAEVLFHETSHFLADRLSNQIVIAVGAREPKQCRALWHNMLFYTTGFLMEREYRLKWQKFEPFYVHEKFEQRFPEFQATVAACKQFWDPYLNGDITMEASVKLIVDRLLAER